MNLSLKRPIVFFDLETTGLNIVTDRIVEISYLKVFPDGTEEQKVFRINPEMHISEEATAVHHITDEDVKDAPTFKQFAKQFVQVINGCDLGGFNSNKFDIPLLAEEFERAGVEFDFTRCKFVDVQVIFHKMERRDLTAAYKFYCHKDLEGAHGAAADIRATYDVLKAQLDLYQDAEYDDHGKKSKPIVNDIDALSEFSSHNKNADFAGQLIYNDKGEVTFNFGKYKGMSVVEAFKKDPGYYGWILNSAFPLYTKRVLTRIKLENA
ncbi:MAG: 3'-5' exonuclease [Salinivirgaceae bacterium]|jgi:DNA polymerase-3 subunit epsilon|nr:3'-5' exonuclease [Salinivirgaceae bacterium]MBO7433943.1 3'-5' exonuclease [Salinivirgaceae bacterium]MBO7594540.1 3'-5' exonuclease [Salinivirgaceae bacterium]